MKFVDKINELKKQAPTQRVEEIEVNRVKYDVTELERKARLGKPLTQQEYAALDKYKKQEISNRILRIAGLICVLTIVALAVGCFLYPYSLLNLFGKNDQFWDCWNHVEYHLGGEVLQKYFNQVVDSFDWANPEVLAKYGSREIYTNYFIQSHEITVDGMGGWNGGWMRLSEIMSIAFQPGTGAKCSFVVIGSWSIVVLSTIGLIAVIVYAIYAVTYNIKDLINLVKHLIRGTKYLVGDVGESIKEQTEEAMADVNVAPKKPAKSKKIKKEEQVVVNEEPTVDEDVEIQRKMDEYKKEMAEEEKDIATPKTEPINGKPATDLNNMSDDELDKLLSQQRH